MSSKSKRFKIIRNAPQKIISVFVAIVLWLIVMDYQNPEMTKTFRDVPVTYLAVEQLAEDQLYAETALDETVDITVQGRRKDVLSLTESDLIAQVDMTSLNSGSIDLPVALSCKSEQITILNANKVSVRVVLDDIVEVHKAVQHFAEGELPDDLVVLNKKLTPSIVTVRGARKLVDTIDKVMVPYSLDDVTASFSLTDSVLIVDRSGQIIKDLELSDARVKVDITVGRVVELPIVYHYKPFESEGLAIVTRQEPQKVAKVLGSVEDLKRLTQIDSVEISLPEEPGQYRANVALALPEGVVKLEPQIIQFVADVDYLEQRQVVLTAADITALNLNDKYKFEVDGEFEKVLMLSGYRQVFQAEDFSAPTVDVDFSGLEAGSYQLDYTIAVDERLTVDDPTALSGKLSVVVKTAD